MVRFRPPGSSTWYNVSGDAGARAATKREAEKRAKSKPKTVPMPRSGNGVTREQAILKAAEYQYGKSSSQAKAARGAVDKARMVPGVIGGVKAISDVKTPSLEPPKYPHGTPLTTAQIHKRETLFGDATVETLPEALKGKSGEITKYQVIPTEKRAKRAFLTLQSEESKEARGRLQLEMAEARLVKWDKYIKDGSFVGSESQYNKYVQDFVSYQKTANRYDKTYATYSTAFNKADTTGKQLEQYQTDAHRAKFGGLIGKYEDAETKAAEQIAAGKTEFKEKYPLTTQRINDIGAFIKKTAESRVVGYTPSGFGAVTKMDDPVQKGLQLDEKSIDAVMSLEKRDFVGGIILDSELKPVKATLTAGAAVAMVVGGPYVKGAAAVIGAGRKVSIAGKVAMYGMGGMYVIGTGIKYTQAGTPREKGAVLGEVIFNEILPLFAGGYIGTKAITAAPKVKAVGVKVSRKITAELKAGTREMLLDDAALVNMVKLKPKIEGPVETLKVTTKPKTKVQRQIESAISKRKAKLGRDLLESEALEIKRFYEVKIPKTQQEIITELKVEAMNKKINDIINFRNQHMRIYEVGMKEPTLKEMMRSVSTGKKPSVYEPILTSKLKTAAQVKSAKYELNELYKTGEITKSKYNKIMEKIKVQEKIITSKADVKMGIPKTSIIDLAAITSIISAFQKTHAVVAKAELKYKQEVKQKTKVLLKTKSKSTTAQKQKAAQKARTSRKVVEKQKRAAKAKAQAKKTVKILPIVMPKLAKRSKPKAEPKTTQYVIYTSTQLNNRVASLQSLFG